MHGILIEGRDINGQSKREPSEIHPVFIMYEGKLPEMLPVLKKSAELQCCQKLPSVLSTIYDTLEDYFMYLCPEAVSQRPPAFETVKFTQRGM